MLAPRFTLRWILALLLVSAVISLIGVQARREFHFLRDAWLQGAPYFPESFSEVPWAIGVVCALMTLAATLGVFAVLFGLTWSLGEVVQSLRHGPQKPQAAPEQSRTSALDSKTSAGGISAGRTD